MSELDGLVTKLVGKVRHVEPRPDGLGFMVNLVGIPMPAMYPCPVYVRPGQVCELRGLAGKVLAYHVRPSER